MGDLGFMGDLGLKDYIREEGSITNARGQRIATLKLGPNNSKVAKAVFVYHHGFSDHALRHEKVLRKIAKAGYICYTWDCHGHGRSEPLDRRGHIDNFHNVVDDVVLVVDSLVKPAHPDLQIFVGGHSMGGAATTLASIRRPDLFSGLVLSAPLVDLLGQPVTIFERIAWWAKAALGMVASSLVSKWGMTARRPPGFGMRDQKAAQDMREDPLKVTGLITCGSVGSLLQACHMMLRSPPSLIHTPIYVQHGTADVTCKIEATTRLLANIDAAALAALAGRMLAPASAPSPPLSQDPTAKEGADMIQAYRSSAPSPPLSQDPTAKEGADMIQAYRSTAPSPPLSQAPTAKEGADMIQAYRSLHGLKPSGAIDIEFHVVQGGLHDLNHDPETPKCILRIIDWLDRHVQS